MVLVAVVALASYLVWQSLQGATQQKEGYVDKAAKAAYERAQGLTGVMAPPTAEEASTSTAPATPR
jgi:hypothetical protein